jgi:hypothetical protein
MEIRNQRPYAVTFEDPETGEGFVCAARPGTVEVPDKLGRNLVQQGDNWSKIDEKPRAKAAADKEGDG